MSLPRRKPLSQNLQRLRNARLPHLEHIVVKDIVNVDPKLASDELPIRAIAAGDLLPEPTVMRYLLRQPIWLRNAPDGKYYVTGNITSWLLARDALPHTREVPAMLFGRSSHWFDDSLAFERVLTPLLNATPRDELDQVFRAVSEIESETIVNIDQINPSVLSRLTGVARETVSKRLRRRS